MGSETSCSHTNTVGRLMADLALGGEGLQLSLRMGLVGVLYGLSFLQEMYTLCRTLFDVYIYNYIYNIIYIYICLST